MDGDRVKAAVMTEFGKIEYSRSLNLNLQRQCPGENEDVRHLRHG